MIRIIHLKRIGGFYINYMKYHFDDLMRNLILHRENAPDV